MIKLSVLYPAGDGATFDVKYYAETHMAEIVARDMAPVRTEVDAQLDGPYIAMGHLYFESMDDLQAAIANSDAATADIPNFTNVEPVTQTSRVVG